LESLPLSPLARAPQRWLAARQAEVLPCRYFHITVTVPEELREPLRSNQKTCYPLLMKAAGEAIIELARDPRYVGGTVGVLAHLIHQRDIPSGISDADTAFVGDFSSRRRA
jgi:hypothetical protein